MLRQNMTSGTKILVVGGNGVLGTKLLALLGPERAVAATRRKDWNAGQFEHVVLADAADIDAAPWHRFNSVINVAGRVNGDQQELDEANITVPVKLAKAARANGMPHFVQVSSFSVYGLAELIDNSSPEAPVSDYGWSKLDGDQQLLALATENFSVATLRLPFLFDADQAALFEPLFKVIKRLPFFPVGPDSTRRSMISYTDAARTLAHVAVGHRDGVFHAAAPTLFDFELLGRLLEDETAFRFRTMRLPQSVVALIKLVAPTINRRLFQSSVLSADLNIAADVAGLSDIELPLRLLINKHFL